MRARVYPRALVCVCVCVCVCSCASVSRALVCVNISPISRNITRVYCVIIYYENMHKFVDNRIKSLSAECTQMALQVNQHNNNRGTHTHKTFRP